MDTVVGSSGAGVPCTTTGPQSMEGRYHEPEHESLAACFTTSGQEEDVPESPKAPKQQQQGSERGDGQ